VSKIFTLEEGDIILTGTPAGVGPVQSGDHLRAKIDQLGSLEVSVR
jgi:5-carboxymethyl-2-hydroxymuconate isomerase